MRRAECLRHPAQSSGLVAQWIEQSPRKAWFPVRVRAGPPLTILSELVSASTDQRFVRNPSFVCFFAQPSCAIDLLLLQACLGAMRVRLELKYSENQPRWPAGDPRGGQWRPKEGGGEVSEGVDQVASGYSFGQLLTQFETSLGRRCVYRFDFGTIVVPGSAHFLCAGRVPSSAVTHGYFLNDN